MQKMYAKTRKMQTSQKEKKRTKRKENKKKRRVEKRKQDETKEKKKRKVEWNRLHVVVYVNKKRRFLPIFSLKVTLANSTKAGECTFAG